MANVQSIYYAPNPRRWTVAEVEILKEKFPIGKSKAVQTAMREAGIDPIPKEEIRAKFYKINRNQSPTQTPPPAATGKTFNIMEGLNYFEKLKGYIQPNPEDLEKFLAAAKTHVPKMTVTQSEDEPTVYIMESHDPMDFFKMGGFHGKIIYDRIHKEQP